MGRMILVANSDLPWSVALTRKYARRKRIPEANIVSVAMGTNLTNWAVASNAALNTALIQPINTLWLSLGAQGVFMGPGTPQRVAIRGEVTNGSPVVVTPGNTGYVSLPNLAANAKQVATFIASYGDIVLCWIEATGPRAALALDAVAFFEYLGGGVNWRKNLTGSAGNNYPTYGTRYNGLGSETVQIPNLDALNLLGDTGNIQVLQGKVSMGWSPDAYSHTSVYPDDFTETSERAGTIMHRALNYDAALSPDNRYQQPILIQFAGDSPTYHQTLAYLAYELDGWGYDVAYAYRVQNATADMLTYAPYAGQAYSQADLDAGRVRDYPYHFTTGIASNLEMLDMPYADAWQPSAGAGGMLGPSEGWQYVLNGLNRGGSGGLSNAYHVTAAIYAAMYGIAHNLLRGLTWAEAMYYSTYPQTGELLPVGDPLGRPFPRT